MALVLDLVDGDMPPDHALTPLGSPMLSPTYPPSSPAGPTFPAHSLRSPIRWAVAPAVESEYEVTKFVAGLGLLSKARVVIDSFINFAFTILSTPMSSWPLYYREELYFEETDPDPFFRIEFNFRAISRHITTMISTWLCYHQASTSSGGGMIRRRLAYNIPS